MSRTHQVSGVFSAMDIAASGLTAERGRMNVIASNLANARTTRGADGQPYQRLDPVFTAKPVDANSFDPVLRSMKEVVFSGVQPDKSPGELVYDPGHPDANAQGYVQYPNVNVVTEMVNLMTASRAYEAGVTSIESIKAMARSALKNRDVDMSAISPVDSRPFVITEGARPLEGVTESTAGSAAESTSAVDTFGNFLGSAIEEANRADFAASQKVEALASGAADDLHGTMISVKEADIAVKLVGTVRNKLLDAFNELWRTSV